MEINQEALDSLRPADICALLNHNSKVLKIYNEMDHKKVETLQLKAETIVLEMQLEKIKNNIFTH